VIPFRKVFECAAPASGYSDGGVHGTSAQASTVRSVSTINPHAAGIDIGATHHVVAVGPDRDPTPVRTFCTFSGDLHALAEWLHAVGITTVAMESMACTGFRRRTAITPQR
jgi:hypothetical protein